MNNEIAMKILELLYEQWFKDYLNGISIYTLISKVAYSENEILQTLEALENNYFVGKNQVGWYVITISGIDIYEENLPPSVVSKTITERKMILEILKEMYDKDIYQTMDDESLKSLIHIDDFRYLLGIIEYLNQKNLVVIDMVIGGAFRIRLSPTGFEALQNQIFNDALAMKNAYNILFNLENHLRQFLELKMSTKHGSDWWKFGISKGVKEKVNQMREDELKLGWKVTSTKSNIEYLSFEHLQKIITNNWNEVFEVK